MVYPYTSNLRTCRIDRDKWEYKRGKLKAAIEAYGRGEVVNFEPLKISIDLTPILEKFKN